MSLGWVWSLPVLMSKLRDVVVSFIFVLGFAFAFLWVNTPAAYAYQHTVPPYQDPTYETPFTNLLDNGTQTAPGSINYELFQAAEAAGRYPAWVDLASGLGTLALAGSAFFVGYKIGRVIDTKWLGLSGNDGTPYVGPIVTGQTWCWSGGSCPNGNGIGSADPNPPVAGDAVLEVQNPNTCTLGGGSSAGPSVSYAFVGITVTGGPVCAQSLNNDVVTAMASVAVGTLYTNSTSDTSCANLANIWFGTGHWSGGSCEHRLWRAAQSQAALVHAPPVAFSNQSSTVAYTMPTTSCGGMSQPVCAPSGSMSGPQYQAAQNSISGSSDPLLPGWVNCLLAPGDYACPDGSNPGNAPPDFTLPQPRVNETYSDYVSRLRALGYLGAVVVLDDPGYDATPSDQYANQTDAQYLNPDTVTGVGVGTTLAVIFPLFWPNSTGGVPGYSPSHTPGAPKIWSPTGVPTVHPVSTPSIVIMKVPSSWTPPAGSPGAGSGSPGSNGGGGCSCPPLNFAPIENVPYGSKWPFGIFSWLSTNLGGLNNSGTALSLHFVPGGTSAPDETVSFASSDWVSTYRPIVWPIVDFVMTLLLVVGLGSKLMGTWNGD